jgi:hypothetical protein
MSETPVAPQCWSQEIEEYLDQLRESAITNMYGSNRYLEREFGLTRWQAKDCAKYYMSSNRQRGTS